MEGKLGRAVCCAATAAGLEVDTSAVAGVMMSGEGVVVPCRQAQTGGTEAALVDGGGAPPALPVATVPPGAAHTVNCHVARWPHVAKALHAATYKCHVRHGFLGDVRALTEIQALCPHPNIMCAPAVLPDPHVHAMVFPRYHIDVLDFVVQYGLPQEAVAKRIVRALFSALACMHAHGYVHRDVKPENVFLMLDKCVCVHCTPQTRGIVPPAATAQAATRNEFAVRDVVLADFGSCCNTALPLPSEGLQYGTPSYFAPEQLVAKWNWYEREWGVNPVLGSGQDAYDPALVDVWDGGLVALGVLVGTTSFQSPCQMATGVTFPDFVRDCKRRGVVPDIRAPLKFYKATEAALRCRVSADARAFVEAALTVNPAFRPTAQQMLQHPWLADVAIGDTTSVDTRLGTIATTLLPTVVAGEEVTESAPNRSESGDRFVFRPPSPPVLILPEAAWNAVGGRDDRGRGCNLDSQRLRQRSNSEGDVGGGKRLRRQVTSAGDGRNIGQMSPCV